MTILQRCLKIQKVYGVTVKRHKLQLFYKRNNIRHRKIKSRYFPHGHDLELLEARRIEFAMDLQQYIFEDRPIIYLDQTTFRTDMFNDRAWYNKKERFTVPLGRGADKCVSTTLFGAVGSCILTRQNFYWEFHEATNSAAFMQFVLNLADLLVPLPPGVRPILLLDNHFAGKGERLTLMEPHFEVKFLPIYSSELNGPIETLWSGLKRKSISKITKLLIRKQCTRRTMIQAIDKQICKMPR